MKKWLVETSEGGLFGERATYLIEADKIEKTGNGVAFIVNGETTSIISSPNLEVSEATEKDIAKFKY